MKESPESVVVLHSALYVVYRHTSATPLSKWPGLVESRLVALTTCMMMQVQVRQRKMKVERVAMGAIECTESWLLDVQAVRCVSRNALTESLLLELEAVRYVSKSS